MGKQKKGEIRDASAGNGLRMAFQGQITMGVFLVTAKNAFVPVKSDHSVNTYSRIVTVPRGSEQSE